MHQIKEKYLEQHPLEVMYVVKESSEHYIARYLLLTIDEAVVRSEIHVVCSHEEFEFLLVFGMCFEPRSSGSNPKSMATVHVQILWQEEIGSTTKTQSQA